MTVDCSRCGKSGDDHDVRQRPHSLAELGNPENPFLCRHCDSEVSR